MKKWTAAWFFLVASAAGIHSLEISVSQSVSNLYLEPVESESDLIFKADKYFFGTDVTVQGEMTPGLHVSGGFKMDDISRKRIFTEVQYLTDAVIVGVGPYFGILNTEKSVANPGISTFFQFSFSAAAFLNARTETTFAPLIQPGDYYQNRQEIGIGMFLPNGQIGLSGEIRRFSRLTSGGTITDDMKACQFTTEVFFKNNPFKFGADFRFQNYTREFSPSAAWYSLYSGIITVKSSLDISPNLKIYGSSSSSVLNLPYGDFTLGTGKSYDPDPMGYIFGASLGISVTL